MSRLIMPLPYNWKPSVILTPDIPELEEGRISIPCGVAVRFQNKHFEERFDIRQKDGQIFLTPKDPKAHLTPLKASEDFPYTKTTTFTIPGDTVRLPMSFDDLGSGRWDAEVFWDP